MSFLLHFLRPEDLFIDIGANVGVYSILASGVAGANTISIEPIPTTYEFLKKNIIVNNLHTKVSPLNIGIGDHTGTATFTRNLDTVNHIILMEEPGNADSFIHVPIENLDTILIDKQDPLLLKIDVEGFEQEVINGAKALLGDTALKAIIIELNGSGGRYGYDELKIHEQLLNYGFCSYMYNPFGRALKRTKSYGHLNTIYLRDIDFVEERLKTADLIKVFSEKY
jgi:FkbM family methyltransferase